MDMRILIAGNWMWQQYEQSFADALTSLDCDVSSFSFQNYFCGVGGYYQSVLPVPGPALLRLNRALLDKATAACPDVLFIWRGTHVLPQTIQSLQERGIYVVSYNNDDPFAPMSGVKTSLHLRFLWYWHIKMMRYADLVLVYRPINVAEAQTAGAKNVRVFPPYFIPKINRPVALTNEERRQYGCDVVFVGHYEPDGRERSLKALVDAGLSVKLYGGGYWSREILGDYANYFGKVRPIRGLDYSKAICGAKLCLAFLSKQNRDTYTRRCFEIPASGRLLLCERTEDLKKMFVEDKEAVFFSSDKELVQKAKWLIDSPETVQMIADAGQKRVWADGGDVLSRARQFLSIINEARCNA